MNTTTFSKPIWSVAFRPFFFLAIVIALFPTVLWVLSLTGIHSFQTTPFSPNQWHANEMIFGFLQSVIIGFLLTASPKWTGTRGIHSGALFFFTLLFFFTRIIYWFLPFNSTLPYQTLGTLIPFCLITHLTVLFLKTKSYKQFIIVTPLLILIPAQILILEDEYKLGYDLSLAAIRFLIVVIAGRIIPFFTKNALNLNFQGHSSALEKLLLLTMLILIFKPLLPLTRGIWIGLTVFAILLNITRISSWKFFASRKNPILFILYLAYLWIPIHLLLIVLNSFHITSDLGRSSLHALSYGCFGLMTLGMIHRVTLGHTGRMIQATQNTKICYYTLFIGSLIRVFGPLFYPSFYLQWMSISGVLWVLSFLMLGIEIIPMLFSPRIDNK